MSGKNDKLKTVFEKTGRVSRVSSWLLTPLHCLDYCVGFNGSF